MIKNDTKQNSKNDGLHQLTLWLKNGVFIVLSPFKFAFSTTVFYETCVIYFRSFSV